MMNLSAYDDRGVRFEHPDDWEVEVTEDGTRTTIAVGAPSGLAFALVTVDEGDDADPDEMVTEALAALKEEYPTLTADPADDDLAGHPATGHDVEFVSLDFSVACALRGVRTAHRTIFILTQWSDLESDDADDALRLLRRSFEETDA